MKRALVIAALMCGGWIGSVFAQTTTPALPAGHPDISAMSESGAASMPALPSGHPDIAALRQATTKPANLATLNLREVQGTKGAPAASGDEFTVEIYSTAGLVKKIEGKFDAKGLASVAGVPFGKDYGQFVKAVHQGVEYTAMLPAAPATGAAQNLDVAVYETTDQAPQWSIHMWHMMVQAGKDGVEVMEMLAVENPNDRAWVGVSGSDGKKTTFELALPAGAKDIQLGDGFHDCCVKIEKDKIINTMALVPGITEYRFAYVLPSFDGQAKLTAVAPAPVQSMMVLLPDDNSTVSASGLEGPKKLNMGSGNTRYFKGTSLKTGQQVKVTIATGNAATSQASTGYSSAAIAKIVTGAGGLAIFIVGGILIFVRAGKAAKAAA